MSFVNHDLGVPDDWGDTLRRLVNESDAGFGLRDTVEEDQTRQSLRDLVWRANNDTLTLLANREWFLRCAEASRTAPENTGHSHLLLVLDLDKFKLINDTRGHAAGDAVLAEIGRRLRGMTRGGDTVGRMVGDEFAVWAERVPGSGAAEVAERYLGIFTKPVYFDGLAIDIAGSIGVVATDGNQPVTEVLDLADAALYEAKSRGTGSFCLFDHTLQARIEETHVREREIVDAVLNALRELGVRIAIDDFGTGHSQLSYLQDLPIDFVKLDRSFVSGFHSDERRTAITASVISLAQALGAEVIAEGVDRPEELAKLRGLGCDHAQGFLLQPPGSPEDLLGF